MSRRKLRLGKDAESRTLYTISDQLRMVVDKMCHVAPYGCKSVWELRVPASIRTAYADSLSRHECPQSHAEFAQAWKAWLKENPVEQVRSLNLYIQFRAVL